LTPLSRQSVYALAEQKGYPAENVYNITGGNPFYVTEILASYSAGVPDNIKDAVLSVYNRQDLNTKNLWQMLSVIPEGLELERIAVINPFWEDAISRCLETKILVYKNDKIYFKHELYRRTIEGSLSPFSRIALNKKILRFFLTTFEEAGDTERIVHYAKNANENNLVVQFAPVAAYKAACVGAHVEASKLWLSAIEYSDGKDSRQLVAFYEAYAYECYLTSQVKDAIIYQGKALKIRKELNEIEKTGNCLRFLSRLWWFEGNRKQAEDFAKQAVDLLEGKAASSEKAMAYSNMSQLKMLSDEMEDCIYWGEKAIEIAREIEDEEPIAHALINMGSSLMTNRPTMMEGISFLHQGLAIGLRNSWHEHVGRAYTALGSNAVTMKDYLFAKTNLDEGISYCEERDLYSLKLYMLCWKARLLLETGNWDEALEIGNNLLKKDDLLPVIKIGALVVAATIKIRRGEDDALSLLNEAKTIAFKTMEPQRIVPALSALLEYEWITGKCFVEKEMVNSTIQMIEKLKKMQNGNRFYYWLDKARKGYLPGKKNNTEQET
ncbi:MAG TPA: hypothetical protein VKI61_12570, partial [Chitinophagaceae bacterium]|nr:hypothetical protein [Chitinophagaceae bacterium]